MGFEGDDENPVVSMKDWSQDTQLPWRTLNCWQCFSAGGRACVRKDGAATPKEVKNSIDIGDQVCCAPDNFEGLCSNDESNEYICSEPSEYTLGDSGYSHYDILENVDGSLVNH